MKDFDKIPMMSVYAAGIVSLLVAGVSSAALQGGEISFWVFFFYNLGAFSFFICLGAMILKAFRGVGK